MPIPSQPTTNISLGPTLSPTSRSISAEFGDPSPHSMSEFYRGGGRVVNHPLNTGVPTSGTISFSQFNGATHIYRYTISANTNNLDLFAYASSPDRPTVQNISQGYNQGVRYVANQSGMGVEFIINPGVVVGSATTAQNALVTGTSGPTSWNPAVPIVLYNQGYIVGAGGAGGFGPPVDPTPNWVGKSGGTAIVAQRAITIQNAGTVGGGGGGGARGVAYIVPFTTLPYPGPGGGGGAGQVAGTGGNSVPQGLASNPGQPGTLTTGGNAGPTAGQPGFNAAGGNGGPLGVAGQPGLPAQNFLGGAAGFYAKGNANITWQQTGTRQGQVQPTV
jgi:hypothetical protein